MYMKSERDTHFQGFAKLLYPELRPLFKELFEAIYPLRDTNREKHAEDLIKLTLTRRAYDMMEHVMLYAPAAPVPDITEWTEEEDKEIVLTFKVPETDFDAVRVEAAMLWIKDQLKHCVSQQDEMGGINAYNLLKVIHDHYMDALGEPGWKKPALER